MMPIGVPKVAYRVPGGQGAEWYVKRVKNIMNNNLHCPSTLFLIRLSPLYAHSQ